jgi:tetratricopeptide (TPR) repeat protein
VVGESSARGEPYHPWVSVGQVVGWQLERVFPGREVRVDVRADGGLCLEQAILLLWRLERRPDALIVFAGHNEFQARYGWSRNVRHYVEEGPESPLALMEFGRSASSAIWLILGTLDRYYGETPPPPRVTRELVDHPTCTPREYAFLREDFHRRLDALAAYCRRIGSQPILIVPPSNDGAFEPSRSVLSGSTPAAARAAFADAFRAARTAEAGDPDAALAAYRRLVEQHPEFAEAHYRLARLLARSGARDEARRHFTLARDLDGLPLRCPSDFRDAFRAAADRHGGLLIDGPELLARVSPTGVPDDHQFHDGQHVNLAGTVALAQEVLEQLHRRRAFGWPDSTPVPRIEPGAIARHIGLDAEKWATVCERSAFFYARTAYVRHDPSERLELGDRYHRAARELAAGRPLPRPVLPSLDLPIASLGGAAGPSP